MSSPLKAAKTYDEQIENLSVNHGLLIADAERAKEILSNVSYYRLSAYGIGLKQQADPEKYIQGITLEHIYHLYQFDSGLRNILTLLIEFVEVSFRTKVSYHLAVTYGSEGYRNAAYFSSKTDKNGIPIHKRIMDQLDTEIRHQENLPCVRHHNQKYGGHFPLWAASELFSFGMICSLYSICHNADRKKIATEYNTTPQYLYGWMMSLLEIRNMCAHYNRIYNMIFKQTPHLPAQYSQYISNRLFPKLLILRSLVRKDLWEQFVNKLQNLFYKYPEANPSFLGFPKNWLTLLKQN